MRIGQKNKIYEPQKTKRGTMKVCKSKCYYYLLLWIINDCVELVTYATIHDSQNVETWLSHALNFMLIGSE